MWSFVIFILSVAFVTLSAYVFVEYDKWTISVLLMILAVFTFSTSGYLMAKEVSEAYKIEFADDIKEYEQQIQDLQNENAELKIKTFDEVNPSISSISDIYYAEAELVSNDKISDDTYQMEFAVGNSEVQIFVITSNYQYPNDIPYLLTMSNNNTPNDCTDDKILVVWGDME